MYLQIQLAAGDGTITSALMDADVLTSLELRTSHSVPSVALAEHVTAHWAGHVLDGHAWLAIDLIRQRDTGADPGWPARFDAMIEYAAAKGWVSPDGQLVRAHIVTLPAPPQPAG